MNKNKKQNEKMMDCTTKDIKNQSCGNECNGIGTVWKRNCPKCNREITIKTKKYYKKCIRLNTCCKSCIMKNIHKNKNHISKNEIDSTPRFCPSCHKELSRYKTNKIRLCKSCVAKNNYFIRKDKLISGAKHYNKKGNKKKTTSTKKYIRECPMCNKILYHTSLHYIHKYKESTCKRCAAIETLKNNDIFLGPNPSYNPVACKIIDEYGKQNGYNFRHALNGGEIHLRDINRWLDGYDTDKNVVIECCEPFHYRGGILCNNDLKRINEIKNLLKCKIIIIKYNGKNNTIEKITKL